MELASKNNEIQTTHKNKLLMFLIVHQGHKMLQLNEGQLLFLKFNHFEKIYTNVSCWAPNFEENWVHYNLGLNLKEKSIFRCGQTAVVNADGTYESKWVPLGGNPKLFDGGFGSWLCKQAIEDKVRAQIERELEE